MYAICHLAGMSSACINPVLYGWLNQNLRAELIRLFPRLHKAKPSSSTGLSYFTVGPRTEMMNNVPATVTTAELGALSTCVTSVWINIPSDPMFLFTLRITKLKWATHHPLDVLSFIILYKLMYIIIYLLHFSVFFNFCSQASWLWLRNACSFLPQNCVLDSSFPRYIQVNKGAKEANANAWCVLWFTRSYMFIFVMRNASGRKNRRRALL